MLLGIYAFCAIVGLAMVFLMLLFGGQSDFDLDADMDLDLDMDMDVDMDIDMDMDMDVDMDVDIDGAELDLDVEGGWGGAVGETLMGILSFRSMLFFMAGFGATGLALNLVWNAVAALPWAVGVGFVGAYFNSWLMRWIKSASGSSVVTRADMTGSAGRVVIPVEPGARGKVAIEMDGQPYYVVARHFNERTASQLTVGDQIVIVDMDEKGTALIARLDELSQGD